MKWLGKIVLASLMAAVAGCAGMAGSDDANLSDVITMLDDATQEVLPVAIKKPGDAQKQELRDEMGQAADNILDVLDKSKKEMELKQAMNKAMEKMGAKETEEKIAKEAKEAKEKAKEAMLKVMQETFSEPVELMDQKGMADVIDKANDYLEKFGSITMSAPVLAKSDPVFDFKLGERFSPESYYDHAKTQLQGKASLLEKFSMALGAGAKVQLDPTQLAVYEDALKKYREISQQNDAMTNQREVVDTQIRDIANSEFTFQLREAQELPVAERINVIDAAIAKYKERMALAGATVNPYPGLNSTGNVPSVNAPSHTNSAADDIGAFTERGKLLPETGLTVSDRVALKIAHGDSAMQAIFSVLGNAEKFNAYDKVYYGVSLVTVTPGWQTRQGYNANLTLVPEVIYEEDAREEVRKNYIKANPISKSCIAVLLEGNVYEGAWRSVDKIIENYRSNLNKNEKDVCKEFDKDSYSIPIRPGKVNITAISPLSNSQNLNLSSSQRDKIEYSLALALALRSAGQEIQADTFLEYAQSLEQDFQTVTEENSVSIAAGNQIEIQVGPVSMALTGNGKKDPANKVLERQTFPVLLLFGFRFGSDPTGGTLSVAPEIVTERYNGEKMELMVLKTPQVKFTQVQNWTRDDKLWRFWGENWWPHPEADHLSSRIAHAEKLEEVSKTNNSLYKTAANTLLQRLGMGNEQVVLIPKDGFVYESENLDEINEPDISPVVSKIFPDAVVLNEAGLKDGKTVTFTLIGSNLDKAIVKANVDSSAKVQMNTNNMLALPVRVKDANTPVIFSVSTPAGITNTAEMPVTVKLAEKKPETYTYTHTVASGNTPVSQQTLVVPKETKEQWVKPFSDIVRSFFEKDKPVVIDPKKENTTGKQSVSQ